MTSDDSPKRRKTNPDPISPPEEEVRAFALTFSDSSRVLDGQESPLKSASSGNVLK